MARTTRVLAARLFSIDTSPCASTADASRPYNNMCYNCFRRSGVTSGRLKAGREQANLTQQEAASRLGLTQAYLSMLERGHRPVTAELAAQAVKVFHLPPTALPLDADHPSALDESAFKTELGALGYAGFSYLRGRSHYNPAQLLFLALDQDNLDRRVVEALPWVAYTY